MAKAVAQRLPQKTAMRARPARALSPLGVLQMAILRRRTTRAIIDLIRQKMKENDEDDEDDEG